MKHQPISARERWKDPRSYQISVLASLLAYGLLFLDFEIELFQATLILSSVLLTQYGFSKIWKLPRFDGRSALISGLSLCLLLRTNWLGLTLLASAVAIASKFLLRIDGKHVFNPTNFGLVSLLLLTDQVWVSPGQWGSQAFFAFLLAGLGSLVANRSSRSDVSLSFLSAYSLLVIGRSVWLGEPLAIAFHHLQSGALLLFSFFMISDPKTTPDSRVGRILFAVMVALGAGYVQFGLFRTNGLLWSLAGMALTVPGLNRLLPGSPYRWSSLHTHSKGGKVYDSLHIVSTDRPAAVTQSRI